MALQDPQAEPSMEEILASIRRIISEEEEPEEPVLDLTESHSETDADAEDDIVFETEAAETVVALERVAPEPPADFAPPEPVADAILSLPTASAAAGSLARLAGTLRIADTQGQTIEGVVRELLKPMLKEWLDRNLPTIVEARVEAELERIARMAR
jgi:hypothetical protein